MPRRRISAIAVAAVVLGGAGAGAGAGRPESAQAQAREPCESLSMVARIGQERRYTLRCGRIDALRLVRPPAHGTVTSLTHDPAGRMTFALLAHEDAPAPLNDTLTVEITREGRTAQRTLIVRILTPLQNTPPWCMPEGTTRRTDGASPALLDFSGFCQDDEQDAMTFSGAGPGDFLAVPAPVDAGIPGRRPGWFLYRTAVSQGEEEARFTVEDELGARSHNRMPVEVGPHVPHLPVCWTPWTTLRVRPGVPRRFVLHCSDADRDRFAVHEMSAPWGRVDLDMGPMTYGPSGSTLTVEGTYTPVDGMPGDDAARFLAIGSPGVSQPVRVVFRPQPADANVAGTCHTDGRVVATQQNRPAEVVLSCQDEDGDTLSASVLTPPRQGSVSPPVVSSGRGGTQELRLTWTPDPAREGPDAVVLRVTDAHGGVTEVTQELEAYGPSYLRLPPPPTVRGLHRPSFVLPPPRPPAPAAPAAVAGAGAGSSLAEEARVALGTDDVRLRRRVGQARLYAPGAAVDRGLPARRAVLRPLAVACPAACAVRVQSWTSGSAPRTQAISLTPGTARALVLRLTAAQRRAIRRARGDAAVFRITVTPAGGRAVTGRMAVRLRP